MADPATSAERLLRRFARDTNLLIAGRPMRIHGSGPTADAVVTMASALGADLGGADSPQRDGEVVIDADTGTITLDGQPVTPPQDGRQRVAFAATHMPVSRAMAEQLASQNVVAGLTIGVSITLEPKTANLALLLAEAGASVAVYAHPEETDAEVAGVLREHGITVDADPELAPDAERAAALGFLHRGLDVLVDDGSHLTRLAVEEQLTESWIGATEETTSGLTPLRTMQTAGLLPIPVMAVNDAATKTGFDNRYGTGQSCVFAIADLLDRVGIGMRDQPAVVIGYGPVGVGVAAHLRALGVHVHVAEIDALRALLAVHDGFPVGPAADLADGALVISATGVADTIPAPMLGLARVVAVAGGVPGEIDLGGAVGSASGSLDDAVRDGRLTPLAPHVDDLDGTIVLDRGGCINVTAAQGNPIEIMDLSFATQLAALRELIITRPEAGVRRLSDEAVAHVADLAAELRGLQLDVSSPSATAPSDAAASEWRSRRFTRQETR